MPQAYLDELSEWLRIPSISADRAHAGDVRRAAEWLCNLVTRAGGECQVVDWRGQPLAVGEIRASANTAGAPTVLVYGHFDVQPPAPLELWESEPFQPTVRDGHLYARGAADDKGQLYLLVKAAEILAGEGSLPVNVRIACDGEEETGGHSIIEFLAEDDRGADVAVIFDSLMLARDVPAVNVATRGLAYFHVRVRTGERDLHSGLYGGAASNAMHALLQTLSALLPQGGRLAEPLRAGVVAATSQELEDWSRLRPGADELTDQGARPADERAAEEFYVRTWAEPSVDVHGVAGGEALLIKTVLPVLAEGNVSIRLAPGQRVAQIAPAVEAMLRQAAPAGADVEIELRSSAEPGLVQPDAPAVTLALDVFEREFGTRPALVRSGGTLPIIPALAERGIATVLTGFALPDANAHAPNERLLVEYVPRGVEVAKGLYRAFATLA
ncbi:MAG: M20/M25/M40 family metallo-hydrolase [Actinomycetota bacterium]|nr:M20/M25/M40 family metallo-hydrolase [Actinomycetota bacterium]